MTYIGVDWASKGWFTVTLGDGKPKAGFYPTVFNMWHDIDANAVDNVLIDIPIGLRESDIRACDVEAKDVLGERGKSVFYTPVRDAVESTNLTEAKKAQEDEEFSIQNQAWGIVPRIREVDVFLQETDGANDVVFETHPEVCFAALGDGPAEDEKKTEDGAENRVNILDGYLNDAKGLYTKWTKEYTEPQYAPVAGKDDIVDAMAAAVTAREYDKNPARLPRKADAGRDEALKRDIEIVYSGDLRN
jgi:predicted RNase H-like nuclease